MFCFFELCNYLQNIRPRFPLFGGWKTNYMIGYNVPSYEYLYSKGSNFALKMRFFDHIYDNIVVDEMTLKVCLLDLFLDVCIFFVSGHLARAFGEHQAVDTFPGHPG